MKSILRLPRLLLVAFTLGTVGTTAALAETPAPATTAPAPAGKPAVDPNALTKIEKQQLGKAQNGVLSANPELKGEGDMLKIQGDELKAKGAAATPEEKTALKAQKQAFEQKLHAAMLAFDPTIGPALAKLEAQSKKKK